MSVVEILPAATSTSVTRQSYPSSSLPKTALLTLLRPHPPPPSPSQLRLPPLLNSSFLHPLRTFKLRPTTIRSRSVALTRMSMEAGVGLIGTKLGMMSFFEPTGTVVPVTVIGFREGNIVTQVKTQEMDGYDAVQVGYRRVRDRKLTKPEMGHLEKSGIIPLRHLQEYRLQSVEGFEPNQKLVLEELFKEGDMVDVSGTTIGKGFQGGGLWQM